MDARFGRIRKHPLAAAGACRVRNRRGCADVMLSRTLPSGQRMAQSLAALAKHQGAGEIPHAILRAHLGCIALRLRCHSHLPVDVVLVTGIPRSLVERAIANSLCFGILCGGQQVGFARVVSDRATFAYIADVYVLEEHRGQGLARRLMEAIIGHPDLQGLRRVLLATRDAHALYAKFGFKPLAAPERLMEVHRPDAYSAKPGAA